MIDNMIAILMTLGRLLVTVVVVIKVTRFRETMNGLERTGLGFVGGTSFLTIPVIWQREGSPFDLWAATILTFGVLMFLIGRTIRDRKHDKANRAAANEARGYLQSRGKL
ncbi:MAG: hypothetical protein PGN16_04120 [Sphingomonas phyllosphaerae]|uniref:hypothetical protein n=1 Tax=Sphingomonas phyllosphaerae TaxID=257003 RepID=UPI002FF4D597